MNVSINPSYRCNLRCDFCYLSNEQLSDVKTNGISNILTHLRSIKNITSIDIYGGEISELPDLYVVTLIDECYKICKDISVITNGTNLKDWMKSDKISLSISYDASARALSGDVLTNLFLLDREYNILGLVSDRFDIDEFIFNTNMLNENCISIELKPFSASNFNENLDLNDKFVQSTLKLIDESNKHIVNEDRIKMSLSGTYNAYSDEHVYITPNNKIASLEFKGNSEYFKEYDSFEEYKSVWIENVCKECRECKYLGRCLTEHYRDNERIESCSGFYRLLEEYENRFPKYMQVSYKYNHNNDNFDDIANDIGFEVKDIVDLVEEYKSYLLIGSTTLSYPLKSYIVSSIFAVLIERDFGHSRVDILNHDIFHGTDVFFKRYNDNRDTYDMIFDYFEADLANISSGKIAEYSKDIGKIIGYYNKEYEEWN